MMVERRSLGEMMSEKGEGRIGNGVGSMGVGDD